MFCHHCGGQISQGSQFCAKCGSRSQAQPTSTSHTTSTQFGQFGSQQSQPQMSHSQSTGDQQNHMALAGLILAFLAPGLGLIFSIIGLSKSKQMNGAGRGMAMAGLIISIVYMVVYIFIMIFYWQLLMSMLEGDWLNGDWATY